MSYDVELRHPETDEVLHHTDKHTIAGGTYVVGGTTELAINITYNYSKMLHDTIGPLGIRTLYGKPGAESIPILEQAINKLKDDDCTDYWSPTDGNVKRALQSCVLLAQMGLTGIWRGD